MVVVPHILVQPVLLRDRYREAGILRLLDRHLTIAVGIDARDVLIFFAVSGIDFAVVSVFVSSSLSDQVQHSSRPDYRS